MPAYVIITSLKRKNPEAYATFEAAVMALGKGGVRFSEDAILIRYYGGLDRLHTAISEHLHKRDEVAIFRVAEGMGLFSQKKTESLFHRALSGE